MSLPQFRPRSPTEIVDAAIQLGRRHYQSLLVLSAIIAIPNLALGLATQWMLPPAVSAGGELADAADVMLVFGVAALSLAWTVIGLGALVASTAAAYVEGRTLEPMVAMGRALRRALRLVASNFVAYVAVMLVVTIGIMLVAVAAGVAAAALGLGGGSAEALGALLGVVVGLVTLAGMLVGGLLLGSRFVNVTAAIMLEDRGVFGAIGRSSELARGNVWRSAAVVLIMMVLYLVAFATSWAVFMLVIRDVNLSANVAGVLVLALYPFLGAMLTLLYYDLRIRREGYDIELMARALGPTGGITPADAPTGAPTDAPAAGTSA